mmetsp:Transcript_7426/g.15808  ORF Transcript_7426/g.15808 Transcript_7426/m.15808 type:complete len:243 (+) Transcript_7426:145-873(+)
MQQRRRSPSLGAAAPPPLQQGPAALPPRDRDHGGPASRDADLRLRHGACGVRGAADPGSDRGDGARHAGPCELRPRGALPGLPEAQGLRHRRGAEQPGAGRCRALRSGVQQVADALVDADAALGPGRRGSRRRSVRDRRLRRQDAQRRGALRSEEERLGAAGADALPSLGLRGRRRVREGVSARRAGRVLRGARHMPALRPRDKRLGNPGSPADSEMELCRLRDRSAGLRRRRSGHGAPGAG